MHEIIQFRNITRKFAISIGCDVTIRKLEIVTSCKECSYIYHAVSYFQQNTIIIAMNVLSEVITMALVTLTMFCIIVVEMPRWPLLTGDNPVLVCSLVISERISVAY